MPTHFSSYAHVSRPCFCFFRDGYNPFKYIFNYQTVNVPFHYTIIYKLVYDLPLKHDYSFKNRFTNMIQLFLAFTLKSLMFYTMR